MWMKYLPIFLFVFTSGCLSGPLPEDLPTTTIPPQSPQPSIESLTFVPFQSLLLPTPQQEFATLTPQFPGLVALPYFNPVDVVSNDLTVLNHPERLQILASIESKYTAVYVEPERETETLLYFTIYKLNDSTWADKILQAYRGQWNIRPFNHSGGQIWIWDGYIDEIEGRATPMITKDSVLYWNPEGGAAFLSERILENHPTLTVPKSTLYSIHGEAASGPYFIMADIKTGLQNILPVSENIFSQVAEKIFNQSILINQTETASPPPANLTTTPSNQTREEEIENLRTEIKNLLDEYLSGNITKDQYDLLFEELEEQLQNLTDT